MTFDVTALAAAERTDFAVLLKSLSPQQWLVPSLCAGWTVRDVVAHMLSYEELSPLGVLRRFADARLRFSAANTVGLADYAGYDPPQLLDLLDRSIRPRGLTTAFGGRIALLDGMIHQQDVRRPLGIPREIPADRLLAALKFALFAPPIHARSRTRGLRLIATDLDWTAGRGLEVRGRGEALLMAIAGRRGVTDELSGPGVELLHNRIGR
ncbi:maleylpyruvate isomerase family mycothiol-dependent enzyme [[Mycobacterium] kokjensenii]|uniref:Maleylpyruvate isomerase family mycothiol-dependent enzyme n=1 Tax=[Mycobacterium] kokjensenii TaxID=3064287 RepID=A0ABM9LCS4_9MYCO|nr:maleylpyruvate isomerase family mycothiol-dependent enzyme [Mycolicibacter sp. MU0083]CAJ1496795.1 maleylpyruvate isomerase family mycothiol-dependent enzyme [Mycolicibacter sp. MU0083]